MRRFLLATAALLATACSDSSGPEAVPCDPALLALGTATGDTVVADNGLRYIDLSVGTGAVAGHGHAVRSHYSGYLTDGTRFDSSCGRGATIGYTLPSSPNGVITGFWQGTVGMREGGVRRVIIPPALGYGDQPRQGIPANSTLIFDIQLDQIIND